MAANADADRQVESRLAGLKKDYETLRDAKLRTETELEGLEKRLAELEARAEELYGTKDPAELEKLLADKRTENERLVAEYEAHVAGVRKALDAVEAQAGQVGEAD